jgi:hypothetical protein
MIGLRAALGVGVLAVAVLLPAAPALAHGADAPDGTNYRTAVTGVTPATAGLRVRAVEGGGRLELTNHTGRTVEVLGYQEEPYLEVRPDGVYENIYSPATYLNVSLTGDATVPATADPAQAPSWRRVSSAPVARWHDHRTHWMDGAPPPPVAADPGQTHRIRDWVVPLRADVSTMEVRGTLDWLPPPTGWPWWIGTLGAAVLIGLLGLRWDRFSPLLATIAAGAGGVALAYAVAREIDAGAEGPGPMLAGLLTGQVWPTLIALATLAAAGYAWRRRPAADLALGLAGACLALIAGATNALVFSRSIAPVPLDALVARAVTAAVIAAGAGLAVAAVLRLRTLARHTPPAPPPAPPRPAPPAPPAPPAASPQGAA